MFKKDKERFLESFKLMQGYLESQQNEELNKEKEK